MNGGAESAGSQTLNRILITADTVGGVWQYTVDLVRCLLQEGVSVITVATMGPLPSDEQLSQLPETVQLDSREYALEWQPDPWADVDAAGQWLLSLAEKFQPDLVHLNGYAHAHLPWRCPVLVVAHSCVVSWWGAVRGCEAPAEWDEYRRRVQAGLAACIAVVAPSGFMAQQVIACYQIPESKVRTIWNFSSTLVPLSTRKEPFCLAAGRVWDEAKNFSVLRKIAEEIPWPILLAGGGERPDEFLPVHVLGRIPYGELLDRMARASIFLHPALYEPFGLAILEAARAGCCLVLSDTASARELWDGAALFCDPRDPFQWARVIEQLSGNPSGCRAWGQAAYRHSQRYNEKNFRESYRAVYHDLLKGPAGDREVAA